MVLTSKSEALQSQTIAEQTEISGKMNCDAAAESPCFLLHLRSYVNRTLAWKKLGFSERTYHSGDYVEKISSSAVRLYRAMKSR